MVGLGISEPSTSPGFLGIPPGRTTEIPSTLRCLGRSSALQRHSDRRQAEFVLGFDFWSLEIVWNETLKREQCKKCHPGLVVWYKGVYSYPYGHCRNGNLKIPLKSPSRLVGCLIYTLQDERLGWNLQITRFFGKENDLNQTSMKKFQPLIFRGVGDEILPNYMGIIEWQSKDPSQKPFRVILLNFRSQGNDH